MAGSSARSAGRPDQRVGGQLDDVELLLDLVEGVVPDRAVSPKVQQPSALCRDGLGLKVGHRTGSGFGLGIAGLPRRLFPLQRHGRFWLEGRHRGIAGSAEGRQVGRSAAERGVAQGGRSETRGRRARHQGFEGEPVKTSGVRRRASGRPRP